MDYIAILALLAGLAMLIMSSILLGSANKLDDSQGTKKTNIKRVSTILLVISIGVVLLYGWEVYKSYSAGAAASAPGFSYYF